MEKKKIFSKFEYVILILSLIIFASISTITFAWFKDKKEYSSNLSFGTIELDVSGKGVDNANKSLQFDVTRANGTYTQGGKIMPGDIVNIPLTISLTSQSEDAYYLIKITDDKNIFENAYYFSDDGTNVYVDNGTNVYNQSTKEDVANKIVGKLPKGTSGHNITIGATIASSVTQQGISTTIFCNIYAIQQANLDDNEAKTKFLGMFAGLDVNKYSYVNYIESAQGVNAVIDSGIVPTSNMKFVGKMYFQVPTDTTDCYLFCGGTTYSDFVGLMFTKTICYFGVGTKASSQPGVGPSAEFHSFDFEYSYNGTTAKLSSNIWNSTKTYENSTLPTSNIVILGRALGSPWMQRLYNFKIYDNNTLVRNFIPCIQNSSKKAGLFDTVSGTFFANSGTGEFTWG